MELIEFKDLPDTSTPINSSNLNNNFNLLKSEIENQFSEANKANNINNASLMIDEAKIITITPEVGSNYVNYGGSYYYKIGTKVVVHLGLSGLTKETANYVFQLPEGYRPKTLLSIIGIGQGVNDIIGGQLSSGGNINIYPTSQYALFDIEFDAFEQT